MSDIIYLTKQEDTVLKYLLDGDTLKIIALKLKVSYSRVLNILSNLLIKTRMRSRNELLINGKTLNILVKTSK